LTGGFADGWSPGHAPCPRLDVSGVLRQFMVRGMERGPVFRDDADRAEFPKRPALYLREAFSLAKRTHHLRAMTSGIARAVQTGRQEFHSVNNVVFLRSPITLSLPVSALASALPLSPCLRLPVSPIPPALHLPRTRGDVDWNIPH